MGLETLDLRQAGGDRRQAPRRVFADPDAVAAPHEVFDPQSRGEARRSAGRQHMAGTGDVVTEDFLEELELRRGS